MRVGVERAPLNMRKMEMEGAEKGKCGIKCSGGKCGKGKFLCLFFLSSIFHPRNFVPHFPPPHFRRAGVSYFRIFSLGVGAGARVDSHPMSIANIVNTFSASVTAATLPKPTLVMMVNVK